MTWRLSTDSLKKEVFLSSLERGLEPHGDLALNKTTMRSSDNSVAGVVNGKLIP